MMALYIMMFAGGVRPKFFVQGSARRDRQPGGGEAASLAAGWRGCRSRGGNRDGVAERQVGRRGPRWTRRWWRQREVCAKSGTERRFDLPWRAAVVTLGGPSHAFAPAALPHNLSPRTLASHDSFAQGATTPKNSAPSIQGADTPSTLQVEASGARTPTAPSSSSSQSTQTSTITGGGTQGESTPSATSLAGGETGQGAGAQVGEPCKEGPPESEEKGLPGGNA